MINSVSHSSVFEVVDIVFIYSLEWYFIHDHKPTRKVIGLYILVPEGFPEG